MNNNITVLLIFIFTHSISLFSQDGGDISYVKPQSLNASYENRLVHIDFNKLHSRIATKFDNKKINDTVSLTIKNHSILFREYRFDDGFNNWFSDQYLESVDTHEGYKIRISTCQLKKVYDNRIKVIMTVEYRNSANELNYQKTYKKEYTIKKKDIAILLFKNE